MSLELHDQDLAIHNAINQRDSEALYILAGHVKEQGDDEKAEELLATARRFDDEDMEFDEFRDNQ